MAMGRSIFQTPSVHRAVFPGLPYQFDPNSEDSRCGWADLVPGNVSLLTASIQCHIGPFKSSDFQKQLQDACMEIRASVRPDHPIMASLPFILRDLNLDENEEHTPDALWKLAMNTKFGKKQTAAGVAFVSKCGTSQSTRLQEVKRNTTQYTLTLCFLAAIRHAAPSRTCRGPAPFRPQRWVHIREATCRAQGQPGGPALVPGRSSPP
jgi:hypothetical protein